MKKTYTKPVIMFEDFSLSASIAAGCERIIDTKSVDICGVPGSGGVMVFNPGPSSDCEFPGDGDKFKYDGFCYHVPESGPNLFSSM